MLHRPWSLSDWFPVDHHTCYKHNYTENITHATHIHYIVNVTHTHKHTESQQFPHQSQSHVPKLSSHTQGDSNQTRPHLTSQQFLQSCSLNLSTQPSSMTKPDQTRPTYTTDLRSSPRPGSSSKRSVMHSQSFIISLMSHKLSTRYAACSWSWRNTG